MFTIAVIGNRPVAAKGRPEIGGIRLDMTKDEVVAVCQKRPDAVVRETLALTDRRGKPAPTSTPVAERLTPPYLEEVMCGSKAGVTRVLFSPPPGEARVIKVDHEAYGVSIRMGRDAYLATLEAAFGKPADQTEIEPIDPNEDSSARRYKWLFAESDADADCAMRAPIPKGETFTAVLPRPGPCATHITLRLASSPGSVIEAAFTLTNARRLADARDRSVAALNKQYGTHFPEGAAAAALTHQAQEIRDEKAVATARAADAKRESAQRQHEAAEATREAAEAKRRNDAMKKDMVKKLFEGAPKYNECLLKCRGQAGMAHDWCMNNCR
jgi:hypothetical protein